MIAGHAGTKVLVEKAYGPIRNLRMVPIPERELNIQRAIERWEGLDVSHQAESAMNPPPHIVIFTRADDCKWLTPKATFSVNRETGWQLVELR
jgi:hypothetical protein